MKESEIEQTTDSIITTYIRRNKETRFIFVTNDFETHFTREEFENGKLIYKEKYTFKTKKIKDIQRNQAEIYSRIFNKTQLELDLFF